VAHLLLRSARDQGLLGQVEGRTVDDAAYWMWQAGPRWRDGIEIAAIDMCSSYASAVRRMLPGARLAVDLSHVVQLAVKMTGDAAPGADGGLVPVDIDATIVTAYSDKNQAAPAWKKSFGFQPWAGRLSYGRRWFQRPPGTVRATKDRGWSRAVIVS
jgi:hypothetical protein